MLKGVGVDLIEISRVIKAIEKKHFLEKIFTENEICLINKNKRFAASNFAAKEACVKIIGNGFKGINPLEIEILRNETEAPIVVLHGKAKELFSSFKIEKIHLSISHDKNNVIAFAVGE